MPFPTILPPLIPYGTFGTDVPQNSGDAQEARQPFAGPVWQIAG